MASINSSYSRQNIEQIASLVQAGGLQNTAKASLEVIKLAGNNLIDATQHAYEAFTSLKTAWREGELSPITNHAVRAFQYSVQFWSNSVAFFIPITAVKAAEVIGTTTVWNTPVPQGLSGKAKFYLQHALSTGKKLVHQVQANPQALLALKAGAGLIAIGAAGVVTHQILGSTPSTVPEVPVPPYNPVILVVSFLGLITLNAGGAGTAYCITRNIKLRLTHLENQITHLENQINVDQSNLYVDQSNAYFEGRPRSNSDPVAQPPAGSDPVAQPPARSFNSEPSTINFADVSFSATSPGAPSYQRFGSGTNPVDDNFLLPNDDNEALVYHCSGFGSTPAHQPPTINVANDSFSAASTAHTGTPVYPGFEPNDAGASVYSGFEQDDAGARASLNPQSHTFDWQQNKLQDGDRTEKKPKAFTSGGQPPKDSNAPVTFWPPPPTWGDDDDLQNSLDQSAAGAEDPQYTPESQKSTLRHTCFLL